MSRKKKIKHEKIPSEKTKTAMILKMKLPPNNKSPSIKTLKFFINIFHFLEPPVFFPSPKKHIFRPRFRKRFPKVAVDSMLHLHLSFVTSKDPGDPFSGLIFNMPRFEGGWIFKFSHWVFAVFFFEIPVNFLVVFG